jgi:2-dehydropantoate 2-reductase
VRYTKLVMNVLGYVASLSASNFITDAICHGPWRRTVGAPLLAECAAVFQAARIELAKVPGRPDLPALARVLRILDLPVLGHLGNFFAKRIYNNKPIVFSLYQDLLRGKPTEIDFINGHVVRLAETHGTAAPFNALAVELCHELQARGAGSFFSRDEVIARFAACAEAQSPIGRKPSRGEVDTAVRTDKPAGAD